MVRFGPAGNAESFSTMGFKKNTQVPSYLSEMGLSAYEYQCGRGVKISQQAAVEFGEVAQKYGIQISLHAPYYISLSSVEEEKRISSVGYVMQAAQAVNWMGGDRIVIHCGSCSKISREEALALAGETIKSFLKELDRSGLSHIRPCIETMGKVNQLGTIKEVVALCRLDERLLPCIDFGHLNARTMGGLKTLSDFQAVFDTVENALGNSRLKEFHSHFSKIEFTKGGEKAHLTFADQQYGPDFEPVAELTLKKSCNPTFICESAGTQAEDAQTMKAIFEDKKIKFKGEFYNE